MREPVVFLDTETGGLDPKVNPILTLGLITLDRDGLLKYPKYIKIIPASDSVISPQALQKNGINIPDHVTAEDSVSLAEAKQEFETYFSMVGQMTGEKRPRMGGHNTRFDLGMIREQFFDGTWPRSYALESHCIDTMAIIAGLIVKGSVPDLVKHGLDDVLPLFGIETPQAHNAFYDAVSSAKLFKAIMKV